jgi:hypothetical protein
MQSLSTLLIIYYERPPFAGADFERFLRSFDVSSSPFFFNKLFGASLFAASQAISS